MPDAFDPYYEWLGIPPREQPVNYYRLLGLELYETNLQVIANAADRQMTFIRTFQTGAHSQESQVILNEISKARVTLLNETRKREYDNNLRSQSIQGEVPSIAPPVPDTPQVFSFNGLAPVEPPSAGSSNSTVQKLEDVSKAERLHRKAKPQRTDEEEKTNRSKVLTIGAVGSAVLVLLTILVLIISFSRSSSTLLESSNVAGYRIVKTVKGVEFAFRWCPAGKFIMGGEREEWNDGRLIAKSDSHEVTLTQGFWILETEVTQQQWQAIMGNTPSRFKGDDLPVEQVSWDDCQDFCKKFNSESGLQIGLPMEAQWEYACRAGTTGAFADDLDSMGWYRENSGSKTHSVGTKQPNAWGLSDMHGNVFEWCSDCYGDYSGDSVMNPTGASGGSLRVLRGGCWNNDARRCRSGDRGNNTPEYRDNILGFRPVLSPDAP